MLPSIQGHVPCDHLVGYRSLGDTLPVTRWAIEARQNRGTSYRGMSQRSDTLSRYARSLGGMPSPRTMVTARILGKNTMSS